MLLSRHKLLEPYSPKISLIDEYLISYPFIKGKLLSETKEKKFIEVLLNYFEKQVNKVKSNQIIFSEFKNDCDLMWFQKLEQRINDFDAEMKILDEIGIINGVSVERTNKLLDQINRKNFLDACIPCFFHGDPSPENILFDNQNNLKLIDPRPIFGNNNSIGDLYYELAKLDHALIVNGKLIRSNNYGYKLINDNQVEIWIKKIEEFTVFRNHIYRFCLRKNWSTKNLSLATALTLLSISTVHSNKNYNNFLLLTGKYFLKLSIESFKKNKPINVPFYIN